MSKTITIHAPQKKPPQLKETIQSIENAAKLLRILKQRGVSPERRGRMILADIVQVPRPPKTVLQAEFEIVTAIRAGTGFTDYDSCEILEKIIMVIVQTLVAGERVKLNRLGVFSLEEMARGQTVIFTPSAMVSQSAK